MEFAKENCHFILSTPPPPPHTTQDSQPLDCTVFGPLRRHWSVVCHDFLKTHPGTVVSKCNFSALFAKAWLLALTPGNIMSGFRKCGVYPFDHTKIPILSDGVQSDSAQGAQSGSEPSCSDPSGDACLDPPDFSEEQIELFNSVGGVLPTKLCDRQATYTKY